MKGEIDSVCFICSSYPFNLSLPENIQSLSDGELVSNYRLTGNNLFVGELFKRYLHLVYGVCMKYLENTEDSKDATEEIFIKLLVDLKKHEVAHFRGWLHQVAKNYCLMQFRKDKTRIEKRPELQEELVAFMEWDVNLHLDNEPNKEGQLLGVETAISQLPPDQRTCIELFYLKEQSYQQVMEATGFDFKQVKSFIQNGKRNLKNIINRQHAARRR